MERPAAPPGVAARLALLAFGITTGLLIAEGGLRLIGFEEELARSRTSYDPRFGTVRDDSWVFDFTVDPASSEVDLRGQRVPRAKRPGETRVLFIGDSGTEGVRIELAQTYPVVFERRMHEEHGATGVSAINAGVFGMTTVDELHFLRQELQKLAPDVVVVGLFLANDLNFNLAHRARVHATYPASSTARAIVQRSALAHFVYLRLISSNARFGWLAMDDVAQEEVLVSDIELVDPRGLHMLSYPLGEIATYVRPPSPLMDRAYETLRDVLAEMIELGEHRNFRVAVLLIPTPSTIAGRLRLLHYPDIEAELRERGDPLAGATLDFDEPTRRVLAVCAELAIPCVDPTARMREIGMSVFFADDEHPTVTGHASLAAELVARRGDLLGGR